jgi:uncharacterized protein
VGILSLLIISLIGSTHCAGMCGGFATFCANDQRSAWQHHLAYNGGRLLVYLCLGACAGVLGSSLDSLGLFVGLSQISATILGCIFIAFGLSQLFETDFPIFKKITAALNQHFFSRYKSLLNRISPSAGLLRPLAVGLSSALLPCGWLYSFVAAAGATGSVLSATTTMFIFWLGTVPMMLSIGKLSQVALKRWGLETSKVAASILIVAGFLAIAGHLGPSLRKAPTGDKSQQMNCH